MGTADPPVRSLLRSVLHFLFPRSCRHCGQDVPAASQDALCDSCYAGLPRWDGLICQCCGEPLPDGGARCFVCRRRRRAFRVCRSAGLFEGALRDLLLQLKYGGKDYLAGTLGRLLVDELARHRELFMADGVVPVPLHFWRRWRRGYNQAALLAHALSKKTGLPVIEGAVERRRPTRSQTNLKRERRVINVWGAFQVRDKTRVKGKSLLLVDDVCTTGATLEACARALRHAGAKSVSALTVARQPLGGK